MPRIAILTRQARGIGDHISSTVAVPANADGTGFFEADFDQADAEDVATEVTVSLQRFVRGGWEHKAGVRMTGGVRLDRGGVQQMVFGFGLSPASVRTLRGQDVRLVVSVAGRTTSVGARYEVVP